jgi:hypothetical protein
MFTRRLPLGELVARAGQGLERRPIDLLKQRASADTGDLHRPLVDGIDPLANGRVQIDEREKRAMAQGRQDPALRDLDTHLGFGFLQSCRLRSMPSIHHTFRSRIPFIHSTALVCH